jgi:hypothetical protein
MKRMDYRDYIGAVKGQYLRGEIDLDQAKEKIAPVLKEMNEKAKVITEKCGGKFKPFTFSYLFR